MRYSNKQIMGYLAIAYGLAWFVWLLLYLFTKDLDTAIIKQVATTIAGAMGMWCPGIAVLVLWIRNNRQKLLTPSFNLNLPQAWRAYLIGWFGPFVAMTLGAVLYFVVIPGSFTTSFPIFQQLPNTASISQDQYWWIVLMQIGLGILLAPFLNTVLALGEEIGWRGFLFPALAERFSPWVTHLLMGVIWGLWHAPFTAMGHNYGTAYPGFPWLGMGAMVFFCFGAGVLLSYITAQSGSIWPAALGHGAINASSGIPMLFVDPNAVHQLLGPHTAGVIGALPLVLIAFWLVPIITPQSTRS